MTLNDTGAVLRTEYLLSEVLTDNMNMFSWKRQASQAIYTMSVLLIAMIIIMATMISFNSITSGWLCHFPFYRWRNWYSNSKPDFSALNLDSFFMKIMIIPLLSQTIQKIQAPFCLRILALADFSTWKFYPQILHNWLLLII